MPDEDRKDAAPETVATDGLDRLEPTQTTRELLRRKLLGNEHPDVAWALYNYAYYLRLKGDPGGAARLSREVLVVALYKAWGKLGKASTYEQP